MGYDYTDPRWQKKRLEILERDGWKCVACDAADKTLHVHHVLYSGQPWEVDSDYLQTLCEDCHAALGPHPKAGLGWIRSDILFRGNPCIESYVIHTHCPSCGENEVYPDHCHRCKHELRHMRHGDFADYEVHPDYWFGVPATSLKLKWALKKLPTRDSNLISADGVWDDPRFHALDNTLRLGLLWLYHFVGRKQMLLFSLPADKIPITLETLCAESAGLVASIGGGLYMLGVASEDSPRMTSAKELVSKRNHNEPGKKGRITSTKRVSHVD